MRKISTFVVVSVCVVVAHAQKNNVCKSFTDYMTIQTNANCYYNEEFDMEIPEIVEKHGYPLEVYEVTTDDGYFITMHRLPKDNPKGVIFFEPPAMSSSIGMIDKGRNDSLGFMLWDAGYDVWIGNFRGNTYGRKHKFLNPNTSKEFWDFSFHEVGLYDIPAQLDFVAEKTAAYPQKITYLGYSMGGTAAVVYGSLLPEHSQKMLKAMVLFGPSTLMKYLYTQALLIPAMMVDTFVAVGKMLNINELFSRHSMLREFIMPCQQSPFMIICLIVELVTSYTPDDIPALWYPLRFAHNPGGISFHIMIHYMQLVKSKKFHYFDYGPKENLIRYNKTTPPEYPLENFSVPVLMTTGQSDKFCTMEDMVEVYKKFRPEARKFGVVCIKNTSHDSFYYGSTATDMIYKPTLTFLDKLYSGADNIEEVNIPC